MNTFLQSFLIGLALAAPLGPSNLTCIRHTLERGLKSGLWASLGVGLGIAVYAGLPALGFSALEGLVQRHLRLFQLLGGLVLLWLAWSTVRSARGGGPGSSETAALPTGGNAPRSSPFQTLLSGLGITLINPIALLAFSALLPTVLASGSVGSFVVGVSSGVALVMGVYCLLATGLRHVLTSPRAMRRVQGLSGLLLGVFGVLTLWQGSGAVWS